MWKQFGDVKTFAIKYQLNPPKDSTDVSLLPATWGLLKIFAKGINLCEYQDNNASYSSYEEYTYWPIDWIIDNITTILGFSPFPVSVEPGNGIDMLTRARSMNFDNETEEYLWRSSLDKWSFSHRLRACNGGVILPNLCFYRINDIMEVSWDNDQWKDEDIYFSAQKGMYSIPITMFIDILCCFLNSIIVDFETSMIKNDHNINKLKTFRTEFEFLGY